MHIYVDRFVYRDEGFAIDFNAMGIFQIHSREFGFKKHGNDFKKSRISCPCYLDPARIRGIPINFIKLYICTHAYTHAYIRETRSNVVELDTCETRVYCECSK